MNTELIINNLEEKLLYILLNNPVKQEFIFANCEKEFFKDSTNSFIFELAKNLFKQSIIVDYTIICKNLEKSNREKVTIKLLDISECFAPSVQAKLYCQLLFEDYINESIKDINSLKDIERINNLRTQYDFEEKEVNTHISANIDLLIDGYSKDSTNAIFTYYTNLDNYIGSFMGGDYIVLGASTSMGKSTFALNIARNVCMQEKNVLYFSLEMPLEQIQNKFICMNEGLNANKYRSFGFNLAEWETFKKGAKQLEQWNLNVICDYGLTPDKMRSYMDKQNKLDFVVLDYLGLMSGYSNKSLYEKTTYLSRNIKLLATEFNVPILCLSQLNRGANKRNEEDKRPKLSDLRESGAIEQDADIVLLLHREGYYKPNISPNELEVWVAKNRHGESNIFTKLYFDLKTQLIREFN